MTNPITERTLDVGNMSFGVLEAGPTDGPLVLCCHGFPDTAWTWRHLLPELAEAGFHGVAPYLRGYAPSSLSPDGRYSVAALVNDAVELHDLFGGGPDAVIIGHDWGSPMAYGAGAFSPDRFAKVIGLAVPPAGAFVQGLLGYDQLKRSFYMFFFQTPFAEAVVSANEMAFLGRLWEDWSPSYDASEDMARVREALAAPENLSAAIGYYRAMFDFASTPPELAGQAAAALATVPQPTLYLHGRADGCLGWDVLERGDIEATLMSLLGPGSEVASFEGLGHFLHLEAPELVNRRILEWLTPA
ncbi:MAG: alpha/beta fold hydrolase [Acidimicrobiales bacterium]|jgi:pimeloyl-ACP methyl ester carboxylesterase